MTQLLIFKIPKNGKIFVRKSDHVEPGTILAEGKDEGEKETLAIANALKISPDQIFKVLLKKLGDKVYQGEVIAKRAAFLKKTVLKSPINGRIVEVSKSIGEIALAPKKKRAVVKSTVQGLVKEIGKEEIKIEFDGLSFLAKKGEGVKVAGVIQNLPPQVSIFDLTYQVKERILVSFEFSLPVVTKAWALEAAGLVAKDFSDVCNPPLPYLTLSKKDIKALRGYQGKRAILDPEQNLLTVLFN